MAKVLISMGEDLLLQIDALATYEERSRSELIREALRQYFKSLHPATPAVSVLNHKPYKDIAPSYVYNRKLQATA